MPTDTSRAKTVIGWRERIDLPDLGLQAIEAKIDTGAKTCALHAWNMRPVAHDGEEHVEFFSYGASGNRLLCIAPIIDVRTIRSSNGYEEERYVIAAALKMAGRQWKSHIALTDRSAMKHALLIGRDALKGRFVVDPEIQFALSADVNG